MILEFNMWSWPWSLLSFNQVLDLQRRWQGSVLNVLHVRIHSVLSWVWNISVTPSYPSIHLFIHLFSVATYLALKVTEVAAAEPSCHVAKDGVHLRQLACSLYPNVWVFGTWEVSQIKKNTQAQRESWNENWDLLAVDVTVLNTALVCYPQRCI